MVRRPPRTPLVPYPTLFGPAPPTARSGCPPDGYARAPMREVVLTVRADGLEDVLDGLLPLLPQGVHEAPASGGTLVLAAYVPGSEEHTPELQSRQNPECRLL